jgi:hypothetical protein
MAGMSEGSVTYCFGQLAAGRTEATAPLWERFFPRLAALARRTLVGRCVFDK